MPTPQHINPETLAPTTGYTHVVKVGSTIYVAGQVSKSADGALVGRADPEAQVRQVWRNLDAALQAVGGTRRNIVKTTTYVTSRETMSAVRGIRDELWEGTHPPVNTLLLVAGLADPDFLVEIEAVAELDP